MNTTLINHLASQFADIVNGSSLLPTVVHIFFSDILQVCFKFESKFEPMPDIWSLSKAVPGSGASEGN